MNNQETGSLAERNIEVARRIYSAVPKRDLAALLAEYHPEIIVRDAAALPYGGDYHGYEGVASNGMGFVETWDAVQSVSERELEPVFMANEQYVAALWRLKATGVRGSQLDEQVISLLTMRDGKCEELQMFHYDMSAVLEFLAAQKRA